MSENKQQLPPNVPTKFDLEQNIMTCWSVVDDIRLINEAVQEKDLDTDSIANLLLGLEHMYELKFQKLQEVYTKLVENKKL